MPIRKFGLVADRLRGFADVRIEEPEPVTIEDLRRVHTAGYINAIIAGEPRELAESQKFPWSPELFGSVRLTNGGCLAAARRALQDGVSAALVSGFHHSCADHGEGFCTFNGLVVALEALRDAGVIRTAAVLDMDLHYGNGTAQLVESRPWIFAVSIYGNDYWDNIPYRDVTKRRHDDGANHRSIALPEGSDRKTMINGMEQVFPLISSWRPDLLLFQAGADPFHEDPYSPLNLDHADLFERDRMVFSFAREHGIPIAWVLAGGYTEDVNKVVRVHLNTFEAWRSVYGG